MSITTNRNILMGSIIQMIDARTIFGDQKDVNPVILLDILYGRYQYCLDQYNAGNTEYKEEMKVLNLQISDLKYKCPDICIYKDIIIP